MAPIGAPVPVVHAVPVTLPLVGTITQLPEHTSTLATRVLKISQLLVVLEIVTAIVAIVQNNSATPMVLSFIIGVGHAATGYFGVKNRDRSLLFLFCGCGLVWAVMWAILALICLVYVMMGGEAIILLQVVVALLYATLYCLVHTFGQQLREDRVFVHGDRASRVIPMAAMTEAHYPQAGVALSVDIEAGAPAGAVGGAGLAVAAGAVVDQPLAEVTVAGASPECGVGADGGDGAAPKSTAASEGGPDELVVHATPVADPTGNWVVDLARLQPQPSGRQSPSPAQPEPAQNGGGAEPPPDGRPARAQGI